MLVAEVRTGIDSVSTASSEIANGNHDLSSRTEQTASSRGRVETHKEFAGHGHGSPPRFVRTATW